MIRRRSASGGELQGTIGETARPVRKHDVCVRGLHMRSDLDKPDALALGICWQYAYRTSSYSVRGTPLGAFAITASARSIAALNSALFHVSTEWPSSNDSSEASRARATNSRSAAKASESSLASAPFREDCVTSLSPSHRDYGPSGSFVTIDHRRYCAGFDLLRFANLCSGGGSTGFCACSVPRQQFVNSAYGMPERRKASTTGRRRDKRGSPVEPQAIDMTWVLPCRSVGARAAPCILTNAIKGFFGTACALECWEVRS